MTTSRSDIANPVLASPSQASTIFGSRHPVRQKGWFYVRFFGAGINQDRDDIGFLVKSADRPSVQPTVEELSQYGKHRLVHTSVKYQPVNISFYDTADNAILGLWYSYARHYFGQFRQNSADAYRDDFLDEIAGDVDSGFGFTLPENSDTDDGIGSQFFFDRIAIYQVYGGEVTAYDLINPKITSFDPDDLDYESTGVATFRMSISYETVSYRNRGRPFALAGSEIEDVFAPGGILNGQVVDVTAPAREISFIDTDETTASSVALSVASSVLQSTGTRSDNSGGQLTSGVLGSFGSFDFGKSSSTDVHPIISSTTVQRAMSKLGVNGGSVESRVLGDVANGVIAQVSKDLGSTGRSRDLDGIATSIINNKNPLAQYGRKSEIGRRASNIVTSILGFKK